MPKCGSTVIIKFKQLQRKLRIHMVPIANISKMGAKDFLFLSLSMVVDYRMEIVK